MSYAGPMPHTADARHRGVHLSRASASSRGPVLGGAPIVALLVLCGSIVGPSPAAAATFVVNTTADGTDGVCATTAGGCTLRDAIRAANALSGADTITMPGGTFTLTAAGSNEDLAATGDLDVTGPVTINGAGATSTIIDAGRIDRVFDIFDTAGNVTIQNLTVRNGFSGLGAVAGGIWNSAVLTLSQVRVQTSEGRLGGGGILNDNDLTANDVTLSGNTTNSQGGGLYNTGVARLQRVTVSGNTSMAASGGIQNDGTLTLTNVTLSGNTAVTDGGGLNNGLTATLRSVTIASNGANRGGGIYQPGDSTINNTIVANNAPGGNCNNGGSITSLGANLDSAATCGFSGAGDQSNRNPLLTPLQNNGGPTLTHATFPGSPAVDVGGSSCPGTLTTDQRGTGFPRALDGDGNGSVLCDSGAYELNPASPPTTTTTTTIATTSTTSSTSTSSSTSTTPSTSTSSSTSTSTSRPSTTSSTSSSSSTSTTRASTSSSTSHATSSSSSTSTSSTSHTTTTVAVGCGAPRTDCIASADAAISIQEGFPGREHMRIDLKRLVPEVIQTQLGNPVTGTTRYDVCVYDDAARLAGHLTVDRAAQSCGDASRPCWRPISTKGYRYVDREAEADGIRSLIARGGPAGRGRITIKARNDARRGRVSMPLGIAAALQPTRSVTLQAVTSDGGCFGATLTDVHSGGPTFFRAD